MPILDRRIAYFLQVAESGSFSAAARKLYLSQPALSKQISQLERELHVQLFDRSGYRPVLTEAGAYLYREATDLKDREDEILDRLAGWSRRTVRIGFTGSFENRSVLQAAQNIKRGDDRLELEFVKCTFEESLQRLLAGEVDLALGIDATFRYVQGVDCATLFSYRLCVICSFDHPLASRKTVTPEQIRDEDFIMLSKAFGTQYRKEFMRACQLDGFTPRICKEVDTFDELTFSVSIGEGIAIVSDDVVRPTEVHMAELQGSHHASSYAVACRSDETDPAVLEVRDGIIQRYATADGSN